MTYLKDFENRHDKDKLQAAIIAQSVSKIWDSARKEWTYDRSEKAAHKTHCPCGHSIVEMCFITNSLNGNTMFVGNVCINNIDMFSKQELDLINSEKVIRDKLYDKITAAIPVVMVVHLRKRFSLAHKVYDIYTAAIRKRKLTDREFSNRLAVNFTALRNVHTIKPGANAVLTELERYIVEFQQYTDVWSQLRDAYFDVLRNGFGEHSAKKTVTVVNDVNEYLESMAKIKAEAEAKAQAEAEAQAAHEALLLEQYKREQAEAEAKAEAKAASNGLQRLLEMHRSKQQPTPLPEPAPAPVAVQPKPTPDTRAHRFSVCQALLLQKLSINERNEVKAFMNGETSGKAVRKIAKRFNISVEF